MKVLFLDIDGVINNQAVFIRNNYNRPHKKYVNYSHRHYDEISPHLLALIRYIVEETGTQIVISSSWRILHSKEEILDVFKYNGWSNSPIIGFTPIISSKNRIRGEEVAEWLSMHPEVTTYAIIDDDSDFLPDQPLFKTDTTEGITWKLTTQIIKHLNTVTG